MQLRHKYLDFLVINSFPLFSIVFRALSLTNSNWVAQIQFNAHNISVSERFCKDVNNSGPLRTKSQLNASQT